VVGHCSHYMQYCTNVEGVLEREDTVKVGTLDADNTNKEGTAAVNSNNEGTNGVSKVVPEVCTVRVLSSNWEAVRKSVGKYGGDVDLPTVKPLKMTKAAITKRKQRENQRDQEVKEGKKTKKESVKSSGVLQQDDLDAISNSIQGLPALLKKELQKVAKQVVKDTVAQVLSGVSALVNNTTLESHCI
jgi:hypothetical protein